MSAMTIAVFALAEDCLICIHTVMDLSTSDGGIFHTKGNVFNAAESMRLFDVGVNHGNSQQVDTPLLREILQAM